MEPNAAWINKESPSLWELVHSPARRPATRQRDGHFGDGLAGGQVARTHGLLHRPANLASGTPRQGTVARKVDNDVQLADPPEPKLYNKARADPSPARQEVHAMYTGVLASSLRLRDLLEQQQQYSPQLGSKPATKPATGEQAQGTVPACDGGSGSGQVSVSAREHGRGGGPGCSQLVMLACSLVNVKGGDGGPSANHALVQHQPQKVRLASGAQKTVDVIREGPVRQATVADGDISIMDLDNCLASGAADIRVDMPLAVTPPVAKATTAAAGSFDGNVSLRPQAGVSGRLAEAQKKTNDGASPAYMSGGNEQQRFPLRCCSPMDLCQAVQHAQSRVNNPSLAVGQESPAAGLTPVHGSVPSVATEPGSATPGVSKLRMQLPEPCPVTGRNRTPSTLVDSDKCKMGGYPSAAAHGAAGYVGKASATQDAGVLHKGGYRITRSRSVSRLNPSHPSQMQSEVLKERNDLQADAAGGQDAKVGAPYDTGGAANNGSRADSRRQGVADVFMADVGTHGQPTAGGDAAVRGARLAMLAAGGAAGGPSKHASLAAQATELSPVLSPPDSNPWMTIAQLAARAASTRNTSEQEPQVQAARKLPADGCEAAAATAVTVQQLSAGDDDDDDNGAPSAAEQEQQQPEAVSAAVGQAAGRRRCESAGTAPEVEPARRTRGGRRGRGRGRGRGRRTAAGSGADAARPVDDTAAGAMVGRKPPAAAQPLGATTPGPLSCALRATADEDGGSSGADSSPDVPIGKLAAEAAAAAAVPKSSHAVPILQPCRQSPGPVLRPLLSAKPPHEPGAKTPAAAKTLVFPGRSPSSARMEPPDSADVPIGILAAAAAAAATSAPVTKSPGSSPAAGNRAADHHEDAADVPAVQMACPAGPGVHFNGDAGAAAECTPGCGRKRRLSDSPRDARPAAKGNGEHGPAISSDMVADSKADDHTGGATAPGQGTSASSEAAMDMHGNVNAAQLSQGKPQLCGAGPAAGCVGPSRLVPTVVPGTGGATKESDGSSAPDAPAASSDGLTSVVVPASKVQLGNLWKRQRVGAMPPPAALLGQPRFGAAGRARPTAAAGALPPVNPTGADGSAPKALTEGSLTAPVADRADGLAAGPNVHNVEVMPNVTPARDEPGQQAKHPEGDGRDAPPAVLEQAEQDTSQVASGSEPRELGNDLRELHSEPQVLGSSTSGRAFPGDVGSQDMEADEQSQQQDERELAAQQPQQQQANEAAGAGSTAGQDGALQQRISIRNVWRRPSLTGAARPIANQSGPMGRRALLGPRIGSLSAGAPAAAAAVIPPPPMGIPDVAHPDTAQQQPLPGASSTGVRDRTGKASNMEVAEGRCYDSDGRAPAVDGECQVHLQPQDALQQPKATRDTGVGTGSQHDNSARAPEAAAPCLASDAGARAASGTCRPPTASGADNSGPTPMEEDRVPAGVAAPARPCLAASAAAAAPCAGGAVGQTECLHRTPPRAPRLHSGGVAAAAPSPRGSAGGVSWKPPRSPGDFRACGVSPSPRLAPSPSPSSRGGSCHRIRDPSLHPAAVAGTANLSPVQPFMPKLQMVAALSPSAAGGVARPPLVSSPSPAMVMAAALGEASDAAPPPPAALGAVAAAESSSFLQPLAPIRTKALPPPPAAAAGVKPSVVQAVEALLSIPMLGDDESPDCEEVAAVAAAVPAADEDMPDAAPATVTSADAALPSTNAVCRLETLLNAATHGSAADGVASGCKAGALHSPLALLVDVAAAQGGIDGAPKAAGGKQSVIDPPSEGPKPTRGALRGVQPFFSTIMADRAPAAHPGAGTPGPMLANGASAGRCMLVCDERLDVLAGKAASPLPPRPRPASKAAMDARAGPGTSRLAGRLSPSKPAVAAAGQPESPVASLRPAEGYSTPPCGTGRCRAPLQGVPGWPRSSSYPGHQYDSMIEDVVQQMLNESSPDGPPPLELGGVCPAAGVEAASVVTVPALSASLDAVTDVRTQQASVPQPSGPENEPLAVNGVAPQALPGAVATQSPQQTPTRRSIYLPSPTGKRRRSRDADEPDAVLGAGAPGGDGSHSPLANGEAGGATGSQAQAPLSGHRRRPRKAARVDGGGGSAATAAAVAAAAAAAAASDKMQLDELSKLGSDDSDSDEDELDSYAAGGAGRGPVVNARLLGPLRGGSGRGHGSLFASRVLPCGAPGGGNWMKPGLAWHRNTGAAPPAPARASPQLRAGPAGPSRPSPSGHGLAGAGAGCGRAAGVAPQAVDLGSPGDSLLDVPRTLTMPRGTSAPRRAKPPTYLSSPAEATNARPTLEQEYREALINSRLAQAWAAGERWARCDLAGLPADLSKRGVTERLAMLDMAASKLNCYRGAEGAAKILAKVEEEWEHLKSIRMAAAARSTVRTPSGTTPQPASGRPPGGGRPLHTPLPFAALTDAAAAALPRQRLPISAGAGPAAPQRNGDRAVTPPPEAAVAAGITERHVEAQRQQQHQQSADPVESEAVADAAAKAGSQKGLAELVSAHAHAHCHRGSPPPPSSAPLQRSQHYHPPHNHHHHHYSSADTQSHPHHHHHQTRAHPSPHLPQLASDRVPTKVHPGENQDGVGAGASRQGDEIGTVVDGQGVVHPSGEEGRGFGVQHTPSGYQNPPVDGEAPAATPPPAPPPAADGGVAGEASVLSVRKQHLQLTPPASILKSVPTPYAAFATVAGPSLAATPPGCLATGGKKAVKFAAVLELGPRSGYAHSERPTPLLARPLDYSQGRVNQQEQE